ncbi:MAG: glycosyltransferase [Anaerolineae bacterium]|nr:glycosyltransferase [Anaerolineae bacterium]
MRFALVGPVHPYRGGIAHYTALLASALAERHEVRVFSFRRQYPRWLYPGHTDRDPSAHPLAVPARFSLDPLLPWTWRTVAREVQQFRPDLVVAQWWVPFWAPSLGSLARLLSRGRTRTVFVCHNVMPHEPRAWDRAAVRWALSAASALVVHSQEEREKAGALGLRPPVEVHPIPTYSALLSELPPQDEARAFLGISEGRVLLFLGLVRPYKGLRILLAALARAFPQRDVRLLVAGEFWEPLEEYRALARELGIAGCVTWRSGYVPNEELAPYLSACDAVVLPYLSATQSAVAQLAFGAGKPVITTAIGGLPDVVEDGVNGLLVRPGDPDDLACALRRFYNLGLGPTLERGVSERKERFSWRGLVELLESVAGNASDLRHPTEPR